MSFQEFLERLDILSPVLIPKPIELGLDLGMESGLSLVLGVRPGVVRVCVLTWYLEPGWSFFGSWGKT